MSTLVISLISLGAIALIFGIILAIADSKLRVEVDPRIDKIEEALPSANCGACGYAGCRQYATAIVEEDADIDKCPVGGQEVMENIAEIMGVKAGTSEKKIARLHCRGTEQVAKRKALYEGIKTCRAATLISSGDKLCDWGCLGYGDCERSCPFDAISMGNDGLPKVDEEKCTACGNCVEACPRDLFELHDFNQNVIVFCKSQDKAKQAKQACKNACIACTICVRKCPSGAIQMQDNCAVVVSPKKLTEECYEGVKKCPTGAIGFIHPEKAKNNEKQK